MENIINIQVRENAGKGAARKTRFSRRVPGVCYGTHLETPVLVSVDKLEISKIIRDSSSTSLFTLKADQKSIDGQKVLIKGKQLNPITDELIHVDFFAVTMDKKIKVRVPVELKGKAKGVVEGGILQQSNRTLNVYCLPNNIPTQIEVDVTSLDINESLHVNDIKFPEGVTIVGSINYTLAVVVPPEAEEAAKTPEMLAAEAAKAPEVTAQKSEGKEDAAAAAAPAGDKKPAEKKEAAPKK
jgi:large subunit ribosomal protein L25